MTVLLIPDISEFQPNADMPGIKHANGGAAIIRAAYGDFHPDHAFAAHRASAHRQAYPWLGIYNYVRKDETIASQVAAFLRVVGKWEHFEVPMLDLEEGDGNQLPRAIEWLARVHDATGLDGWGYSYVDFVEHHGLVPMFDGTRVRTWIASYSSAEPSLGHTLWQCTNGQSGSHRTPWPGCGFCDTSLFRGSLADLVARTWPAKVKPKPPGTDGDVIRLDSGPGTIRYTAGTWHDLHLPRQWTTATPPTSHLRDTPLKLAGGGHPRELAGDLTLHFSMNGTDVAASGAVRFAERDHTGKVILSHHPVAFMGQDVQAAVHMHIGAGHTAMAGIRVDNDIDVQATFAGLTRRGQA
jgi:hypothetical protein